MKNYTIKVLITLLIISSTLIIGCNTKADETESVNRIPVKTAKVVFREFSLPIHTSGLLSSIREIRLSFKVGGIIDRLYTDEGEQVYKGQLLAELNQSEIYATMLQAQSGYDKAHRDLERVKILFTDSVATLEQLQDAETALKVAQANLEIARFNLKHAKIYAPSEGKILKRFVEANELIGPGNPVFLFGSSGEEWIIRVGLSDKDIIRVNINDSASVTFDVYPNTHFPAYVTEIAQSADLRTGTFELEINLKQHDYKLISGFVATVDIFPRMKRKYHLIPVEALNEAQGNAGYVFAVQSPTDGVKKIPVQVDCIFEKNVVVTSGLEQVKHVITDGAAYLVDGSLVSVMN
jgi:multidrug efflux system membrane fusion protein